MNKNDLNNILKSHVATITFTKKNGETRRMVCTTNWDALKKHASQTHFVAPDGSRPSAVEGRTDMLLVWDLEKENWRIVTVASVEVIDQTSFEAYLAA